MWPFTKKYELEIRVAELEHKLQLARRDKYRADRLQQLLDEVRALNREMALEIQKLKEQLNER